MPPIKNQKSKLKNSFTLALLQFPCSADPQLNTEKTVARIREAARQGANVICTPEFFRTPYFPQSENPAHFDLAESLPGPTTRLLSKLAKLLKVVLIASLFERRAAGLYHNSAAVLDADGSLLGVYRKMHIPDDPLFYEKYYFTPGDPAPGFQAFNTRFGRIGVLICWDQWFPEAARIAALQGPTLLLYPTAIGWHPKERHALGPAQLDAWQTIQRAHAIANGVYVAAANRIGFEPTPSFGVSPKPRAEARGPKTGNRPLATGHSSGLLFWGHSFIADPFGRVLAQANSTDETILLARIDPKVQEQTRQLWPFLRDRRLDAYAPLLQRHTP